MLIAIALGGVLTAGTLANENTSPIEQAHSAAAAVSAHNIQTALELHYIDTGRYPEASSARELVAILADHGYIRKTGAVSGITYTTLKNGRDYTLTRSN